MYAEAITKAAQSADLLRSDALEEYKQLQKRADALRAVLRAEYGKGHYRITGHLGINEEVHVYGQMPNSTTTGWWLMGSMDFAEFRLGIK